MDQIVVLVVGAANVISVHSMILKQQSFLLVHSYGSPIGLLVSILLRDTATQYERIERDILHGSDEEALSFRQSVTDECNMTAVAGAIIAQVAITGLSLPNLSSAHWIARALLLIAVVSGCLSVYYACVLQRIVGKLYRPDRIRNWLRLPPPLRKNGPDEVRASLAAVFIISAPFTMVKVSIFTFLLGLATYQGFAWTRALDTSAGPGNSRSVFIAFTTGTGICACFFVLTFASKNIEDLLRVGLTLRGGYGEGNASQGPPPPRHPLETLAAALDAAAEAHNQCAEVDRQVALAYAQASNTQSNTHQNTRSGQAQDVPDGFLSPNSPDQRSGPT